jgi:orotate phosphoribosyltransferase
MKTGTADRVTDLMKASGALMKGHFRLSSGLHSDEYCQCAKVAEHPEVSEELGRMLADLFRDDRVDVVVSPAIGGIVIGYEVARALGVRAIWAERTDGAMALRRGFGVSPGERALIIEDVVTTGGSVREVAQVVKEAGAEIAGFGFIMDRSRQPLNLPGPTKALLETRDMKTYDPDTCPLCAEGIPVVKPGSKPTSS